MAIVRKGRRYSLEEVLKHVGRGKPKLKSFDGDVIDMKSQRYRVFKDKGTACVVCGIQGQLFAKERHDTHKSIAWHFNLYALDPNGIEVLMTKDHIVPRSAGGRNALDNYQPMCTTCNNAKGAREEDLMVTKARVKKGGLAPNVILRRIEIGSRLKKARINRGLTQAMLATCMKVKKSLVSKWERGKSPMRSADFKRAALILGISVADLTRKETSMKQSNEEELKMRAYYLWERLGKPEGRDEEIWLMAQAEATEKPLRDVIADIREELPPLDQLKPQTTKENKNA